RTEARMALRYRHHGCLRPWRRRRLCNRLLPVRIDRTVAANDPLLGELSRGASLVQQMGRTGGVRRRFLSHSLQDFYHRGWSCGADFSLVCTGVLPRPRWPLLPGSGLYRGRRRTHGDAVAQIRGTHWLGRRRGGSGGSRILNDEGMRRQRSRCGATGAGVLTTYRLSLLLAVLFLTACGTATRRDHAPDTHIVRAGETLFTIAWRYGRDYRDLARWNRLGDGSLIYP